VQWVGSVEFAVQLTPLTEQLEDCPRTAILNDQPVLSNGVR